MALHRQTRVAVLRARKVQPRDHPRKVRERPRIPGLCEAFDPIHRAKNDLRCGGVQAYDEKYQVVARVARLAARCSLPVVRMSETASLFRSRAIALEDLDGQGPEVSHTRTVLVHPCAAVRNTPRGQVPSFASLVSVLCRLCAWLILLRHMPALSSRSA